MLFYVYVVNGLCCLLFMLFTVYVFTVYVVYDLCCLRFMLFTV